MFVLGWDELATGTCVARLYDHVGRPELAAGGTGPARELLAQLLRLVGGLPLSDADPTGDELTARAEALLDDAVRHTLRGVFPRRGGPAGYGEVAPGALPFDALVRAFGAVEVNSAPASDLEALPALGPQLAARIVRERRTGGEFSGPAALAARVSGIGPATLASVEHAVSFAPRAESAARKATDGPSRFRLLAALAAPDGSSDPVHAALDMLCAACAPSPHPATSDRRRVADAAALPSGDAVEWMAPLVDQEYHEALSTLLDEASGSISVCMFHIAAGNPTHPSVMLLEQLIAAHGRGVDVRVLLDRDREEDPYNSEVVNRGAIERLADQGVPVRTDAADRLLHSKFLVLDGSLVIVGSHNWSIGSFFEFDDVSVAIRSPDVAASFAARFEGLWDDAEDA